MYQRDTIGGGKFWNLKTGKVPHPVEKYRLSYCVATRVKIYITLRAQLRCPKIDIMVISVYIYVYKPNKHFNAYLRYQEIAT